MEDFDAAIGLDPKRWKSYHHRGVCYALIGQFEEALRISRRRWSCGRNTETPGSTVARSIMKWGSLPRQSPTMNRRSDCSRKMPASTPVGDMPISSCGGSNKRLNDYGQAVALDPKNSEYFANRGDAYRSFGQLGKAANDFRQAISLDKSYGRAYQSAAWLMATCPDPQFRNPELAVRICRESHRVGRRIRLHLSRYAGCRIGQQRPIRSRPSRFMRRAIEHAPKRMSLRCESAWDCIEARAVIARR